MPPIRASSAGVLIAAVLLAGGAARAAVDVPLLPPSRGDAYAPDEALVFDMRAVPDELAYRLALEIDGAAVTHFVQREGDRARLVLPIPLGAGEHDVRLAEIQADAAAVEVARWTVRVRGEGGMREAWLEAMVIPEVSQRLADQDLRQPPGRTQLSGEAVIRGGLETESTRADLYFPAIYDSTGQTPSGDDWDLADFLATAHRGPFDLRLGHHTPGPSSLVLEQFHRRGASATVDLPHLRSRVTGFTMRSEPITGFEGGLGFGDPQHRVAGATWEAGALAVPGGQVGFTGTWLSGQRDLGGVGVDTLELLNLAGKPFAEQGGGSAWSAAADGLLFGERLRLRGEYAQTHFNPDSDAAGTADGDEAWSAYAALRPWLDRRFAGHAFDTQAVFEYRVVGPRFESPANPGAPMDRRLGQLGWRVAWAGFSGFASVSREWDNVDDDPSLPRFQADTLRASLDYEPPFITLERGVGRWLGRPRLGVRYARHRLKPVSLPDPAKLVLEDAFGPFEPIYTDQWTRTLTLSLGSTHRAWSWNASHTELRIGDRTNLSPDTRSNYSAFDLTLWSERGSLSLALQHERREELVSGGNRSTRWTGTLWASWGLVPGLLDGSLGGSWTDASDRLGTFDERVLSGSAYLTWHAIRPRERRPGLTLILSGTYQDLTSNVQANLDDSFQVFLRARLVWPVRIGR